MIFKPKFSKLFCNQTSTKYCRIVFFCIDVLTFSQHNILYWTLVKFPQSFKSPFKYFCPYLTKINLFAYTVTLGHVSMKVFIYCWQYSLRHNLCRFFEYTVEKLEVPAELLGFDPDIGNISIFRWGFFDWTFFSRRFNTFKNTFLHEYLTLAWETSWSSGGCFWWKFFFFWQVDFLEYFLV